MSLTAEVTTKQVEPVGPGRDEHVVSITYRYDDKVLAIYGQAAPDRQSANALAEEQVSALGVIGISAIYAPPLEAVPEPPVEISATREVAA